MSRVDEACLEWHNKYADNDSFDAIPVIDRTMVRVSRFALADAYAKLRDEQPITEEWARSVRSRWVKLDQYPHDPSLWYCLADMAVDDDPITAIRGFVTTRGQVRSLLLAARIECDV